MNRDRLASYLEASDLLPAVFASRSTSLLLDKQGSESRQRLDLNGTWERNFGDRLLDFVAVPSSLRPSGYYQLKRNFVMPRLSPRQRAVLHFEAITYYGHVSINGNELGSMVPYVPHEFDITPYVKEGSNAIEVAIADMRPAPSGAGKDEIDFGVVIGWEVYGGIIRDVYVEIRPAAFIENVRFAYKLDPEYRRATCRAQVYVSSSVASPGRIEVRLFSGKSEVARGEGALRVIPGSNEGEVTFDLDAPRLWSPEAPNLYRLVATLNTDAGVDHWQCRTGFRDIAIQGRNFLLNGNRLVLNGICRMELWKDQGFTMTHQQMQQDMQGIKRLGCNFVRLQPFPHARGIIELADELGLLVSEEPGYWWANFETCPRSFVDLGLNVLERNIRRDWNSPSVMIWFLGNESYFTLDYLRAGKALCNRLDPIFRPVSMAHQNYEPEKAKKYYDEAGLDFYDWHAYEYADEDKFDRLANVFGPSKPLTLSEWGWEVKAWEAGALFWERNFDLLADAVEAGKIAGHMFFDWNDYPQFSRRDWSTDNGVLLSGVVKENREARPELYRRLAGLFAGQREAIDAPAQTSPTVVPLRWSPWSVNAVFKPVDLQALAESSASRKAWASLESQMANYWANTKETSMGRDQWKRSGGKFLLWKGGEIRLQRALFQPAVIDGFVRPLTVTPEAPETIIPVGVTCKRLHFLGHISLPTGYPLLGQAGEAIASYRITYASGKKQEVLIRNGIEVVRGNRICDSTRFHPVAIRAQQALTFTKDFAREEYQVLLFSVPTDEQIVSNVTCTLLSQRESIIILALTAEVA
ncbi:MAG: glycoside hydrolase family 2 TIM barrel-domain containing protein [Terriglobia bacterium]